ncbi:MAG TPA: hypothetical protein VFL30_03775 [Rhodanobacteraceae bacterium]|nr:hypothetical protein [Rhodanobacteraceae bacterium]
MKDSFRLRLRVGGLAAAVVAAALARAAYAEVFVDVGFNSTNIEADISGLPDKVTSDVSGAHLGLGFRRELTQGSIGARLELDDLDGESLLAVRAFDWRRHVSERFALTAFAGAARLDLDTPAYGWYLGGGVQLKDLWPRWDLGIDLRIGDKLARDNFDPQAPRPDDFYDLRGVTLYLSRRF